MNRIISFLLIISFFACTPKTPEIGYKINGSIDSLSEGQVILKRYINGAWNNIDTSIIQAGKFTFDGKVDLPEMFRIVIADSLPYIPVFIDNNEITVTGSIDSLEHAKIVGSKIQEEYRKFMEQMEQLKSVSFRVRTDSMEKLYETAIRNRNTKRIEELDSLFKLESYQLARLMKKTILYKNSSSVAAAYFTWTTLVYDLSTDELDTIVHQFDPVLEKSIYIKMLKDYIAVLRRVEIGQPAIDFTMNDPEGKPVSLSSLYGKYLLIDFWAAWCSPCRRENPNIVQAYKQFHKKGFDILGVSFDKTREAWLKAIKDDKLEWAHVSDLKYWGNEAGKAYGIRSIPSNVLLDPQGIIIAKNLHGKELHNKLKEIFNK